MDSESFVGGGPLTTFFLADEGREDPNTTIRMMTRIAKIPYTFVIFQVGSGPTVPPPDPPMLTLVQLNPDLFFF